MNKTVATRWTRAFWGYLLAVMGLVGWGIFSDLTPKQEAPKERFLPQKERASEVFYPNADRQPVLRPATTDFQADDQSAIQHVAPPPNWYLLKGTRVPQQARSRAD